MPSTTTPSSTQDRKQFLAVLPQDALEGINAEETNGGREFLRLPHPRNNQPSLYLPYHPRASPSHEPPDGKHSGAPTKHRVDGLLEVQKVEPDAKRSWFLEQTVISDGSLMLMTPVDPLFLVIPLVASLLSSRSRPTTSESDTKTDTGFSTTLNLENDEASTRTDRFLPIDDLIVEASRTEGYKLAEPFADKVKGKAETSGEGEGKDEGEWMGNEDVIRLCQLESVRERLKDVCETQTFGQPSGTEQEIEQYTYYRASPRRILHILRSKTEKLANPATLSSFPSLVKQILRNGLDEDVLDAYKAVLDSVEGEDKALLKKQEEVVKQQKVAEQARTRVACEIVGQYLPADVHQSLVRSYDFSLLEAHLDTQAAVAFASSHTVSGKTNGGAAGEAAAKPSVKRKGSGQGSRGVEALKKVNTSKMPKLTSFFTKKPKE